MTVLPEIFEESEASAQTKCANLFRPEYGAIVSSQLFGGNHINEYLLDTY